jgi:hypothetical protein
MTGLKIITMWWCRTRPDAGWARRGWLRGGGQGRLHALIGRSRVSTPIRVSVDRDRDRPGAVGGGAGRRRVLGVRDERPLQVVGRGVAVRGIAGRTSSTAAFEQVTCNFWDAIREGADPEPSLDEGLRVQAVFDAVRTADVE